MTKITFYTNLSNTTIIKLVCASSIREYFIDISRSTDFLFNDSLFNVVAILIIIKINSNASSGKVIGNVFKETFILSFIKSGSISFPLLGRATFVVLAVDKSDESNEDEKTEDNENENEYENEIEINEDTEKVEENNDTDPYYNDDGHSNEHNEETLYKEGTDEINDSEQNGDNEYESEEDIEYADDSENTTSL